MSKNEIGRWEKKVAYQKKQIDNLTAEIETMRHGVEELNTANMAYSLAVALAYGEKVDGGLKLVIPAPCMDFVERYDFSASVDNGHMEILISEKEGACERND